jgi:hypothetical protein
LGGLIFGIGLVALAGPLQTMRGRRWSDYLPGRRWGDAVQPPLHPAPQTTSVTGSRRTSDPAPAAAVSPRREELLPAVGDRRGGVGRRASDR